MGYPKQFIEDLKRQADIVRIVQDYLELKKKGSSWMACCPFHQEDTPSFSVSPSKEIFYCFGCQKGGNVYSFVMEIERVSFPEAVRIVSRKAGIPLPAMSRQDEEKRGEAEYLIALNQLALGWWEEQLILPSGQLAREYLHERGISDEARKEFHIGYAPNSWEGLTRYLLSKQAPVELLEKSGLVVSKSQSSFYDRFRGRLIIPVFDLQARAIAFNGRTLVGDEAKYVNSPDTAVYSKGQHLFGMHLSKGEIRKRGFVILVEGCFDLITPYSQGVRNVVASLGTSFTQRQADLILRFSDKVVINYDSDSAGLNATKKAIEILLPKTADIKVLSLPESDPDSFIREHGIKEYRHLRSSAKPFLQFLLDYITESKSISNPSDKAKVVDEIAPFLKSLSSDLLKREYFDLVMNSLKITDQDTRRELWGEIKYNRPPIMQRGRAAKQKCTFAEKKLLEILLSSPEARAKLCPTIEDSFTEDLITHDIFKSIKALESAGLEPDYDTMNELLLGSEELQNLLPQLLFANPTANPIQEAERCINSLWLLYSDKSLASLKAEMSAADQQGTQQTRIALSNSYLEIIRKRAAIQKGQNRSLIVKRKA